MKTTERDVLRDAMVSAVQEFFMRLQTPPRRVAKSYLVPAHANGKKPTKARRGRPGVPADVVARMRKLKAKGMPAQKIAKQVGLSHFTVYKYTRA